MANLGPADDDVKVLDPVELEVEGKAQDCMADDPVVGPRQNKCEETASATQKSILDPLLKNPGGVTQIFNDMHGIPVGLEEDQPHDTAPASASMRHAACLTVGAQRSGVTDWGAGTDCGRSGKPLDGVPYCSLAGV
ncbi:uncharacterized protein [Physcomitrium patens]|uniref:uncharacterized protein n=1 Tax=Physcomitrium patens TaxID=3218 RepID=UPI000D1599D3|nr:uncharacterized protein LOC112281922 [Physcomitrium patens]|eukprot:XP_024374725.1 uncharacterized protein LOC112281922 [Physcomitrella patens]